MGRRKLWLGIAASLTVGYFYGILRANIEQTSSHFIYDGGALGLYFALATQRGGFRGAQRFRLRPVAPWALLLIGWPTLLLFVPIQNFLIQLVGWRGQVFFVPFILIGAILDDDDLRRLGRWMGLLNAAALAFALAEVSLGVPRFFPYNAVDEIIYRSNDVFVGAENYLRIPAMFSSSATYAGTMVASMPLLLGAVGLERNRRWRYALMTTVGLSAIGVFLAASRSAAVLLFLIVGVFTLSGRFTQTPWALWVVGIVAVGLLVAAAPRLQRFLTLDNTRYVENRVHGSVNEGFFDLAADYPMGNGLGGGGTSVPYFLRSLVKNPIGMENEYTRIMLEQGIPGLTIWLAFIAWVLTRPPLARNDPWLAAQGLARLYCAASFATAMIGTGLLTAIPSTSLLMLFCGWLGASRERSALWKLHTARTAQRRRFRPVRAHLPR